MTGNTNPLARVRASSKLDNLSGIAIPPTVDDLGEQAPLSDLQDAAIRWDNGAYITRRASRIMQWEHGRLLQRIRATLMDRHGARGHWTKWLSASGLPSREASRRMEYAKIADT